MSLSDDIISGRFQYGQDVNPVKKRKQTLSEQIISGTYQYEEPTIEPTKPSIADNLMQFQDNFTRQSNILDVAQQEYQKALGEAYRRNNVNYDTRNLFQPREQFSRESKYVAEKPMLDNKPEDIKRALQEVEPQRQKANEELNKYLYAKYQKDQAEVENEDTTFYDKTLGNVVRGGQDLFSIFNTDKYRTEDGREITLPSRNELKQQKVSQDYDTTLGRIGGDVAYNVSKIATADLLNKATGGVGGSAIYWADMFGDNYKNAVNQGYDKENALVYSAVGTGAEFLTGKFLGSATKGLTGGKTSELSTAISNVANKLVKNKTVSNIIGNMGSEAAEEFVQEYIDNLNEIVTLEQSTNPKDYAKVFTSGENLENALYSAAVGALSGGLTNIGGSIQEARTPQISPIEEQNNLNNTITPQAQETSLGSLKTSALDYNIDTENGTINSVDKMMSDRGIKASFNADLFDNNNVNAFWRTNEDGTREVIFNPNANTDDLFENTAVHELYHDLVNQEGKGFLQDVILNMASTKDGYIEARKQLEEEYSKVYDKNNKDFGNMVNEEATAIILGKKLGNQEFINELTTTNKGVARKIYDAVVSMLNKLNKLTGYKFEKLYWTDVKNKFENAYSKSSNVENKVDSRYSINEDLKNSQFDILQKSNPMLDDYHTGIRSPQDIKSFEETLDDDESFVWGDFSREDAEKAVKSGNITVYSSYPIEQGVFVSTSKNQARDYAGGGKIYEKTIPLNEVAWINGDEGQYAKVGDIRYSISSAKDNQGRELSKEQQEFFKDSKVRDENGNLIHLYHGSPATDITTFKIGRGANSEIDEYGAYFTDDEKFADDFSYEREDTDVSFIQKKGKKGKVYDTYANIKQPLDFSKVTKEELDKIYDYANFMGQLDGKEKFIKNMLNWQELGNHQAMKKNLDLKELAMSGLYDGIIAKTDVKGNSNEYIVFNPNQVKDIDNTNPTENEDIRYSKGTTYQDFVNKNFKSNGTGNKLKDIRKPKEQKKTMALVDAKPVAPKEKVAIVEAAKPVKETPKRVEAKKETKPVEVKPLLTKEEQQELNTLENIPFDLSTKEEQRLQYLKDKQAGVKIKHESLIEKQTYDTVKNEYRKYKNKMETFDNTALNKSKETISGNKQGRRTKEQWLDVAEHLGSNIKDMDSKDLEKYAIQSFIEARPNQKENLNRQGQKYVEFKLDDWLASVYKGAGVGEKYSIETKAPEVKEKQKPVEIAETKTEDLVIKAEEPKKVKAKPKPVDEKVAKILEERPVETKEEKGKIRKLLTTKILDKGYYVDKLARATKNKELSSKYDYMLMANGISQQMIGEKNFNPKTQKEVGKSLFKIFEPIENSGQLEKFSDYIYHKHNIDRMSLDTTFGEENKPVFGDTITKEKSQEIVNKYEKDNPEFKEWAKEVYEYNNNLLDILVDYGVISKADKEYYNNKYPNYVPIVRDNNNVKVNVEAFGKKAAVRNPIKKAKGGSQDIIPLKEAMSLRTMQTIKSALSNNFGTELYNILGGEIEGETANIDEAIENSTDERLTKSTKDKSATLSVFKDGKKVTFDIPDEIYEALAPSERYKIKGFNAFSNLRRSLTTEYNPAFMITNPVKDVQDGLLNSKHPTKFAKNIAEATMQIKKKGKYYQQYMANGGAYETYFNYDKGYNKAPEKSGKSFPRKVLNKIGEVNEAIELTPRLAEFISSIEAGDSVETAMYNAQEITTNFKRGGNWTKNIDANGATFLNAGVQGAVKQIRNIQEARTAGIKGMLSLAAKWTIAGTTPYLLSQLVFGDDDDYEDLSDYIKNNYYILWKNSDGNFIRIPKGRVMSVIQNAFEQPLKALKGRKINVKEFVDLLQNQILPNNPTESNIFSPLVDAAKNKTWYGGDLVSPRLQKLPEREQFDESTDSISKWIGKITGISPVKINYILDQYSGAIGDMVLPYLTLKAEGKSDNVFSGLLAPMRDKFTADSVMKNQNIRDFYDLDTEVTKKANSVKATDADILKSKYINGVKMEMSLIAKEQREIQLDRSLKNSEKYEQVRSKQREINRLAKTAIKEYESSTVKSNYGKINNVEYYKNNDNEWVKIPAKEVQKLDEQGLTIEERNTYFETKNKISEIRDNEDLDKEERRKQVSQAVSESDLTPDGKNFIYGKYYSNKDKDGIPLYDYYAEKVYNNR